MKISVKQYLEYLIQFRGENLFSQPSVADKVKAVESLKRIEEATQIELPPIYRNFYLRLYPFKGALDFSEIDDSITMTIQSLSTGGLSYLMFHGFITDKDIITGWEWVVGDLNKEYGWELIRIGHFTEGDLYMGYGKHNADKIYWVSYEQLQYPEDNNYRNPAWNDCYGIRYIAKDVDAFIRTLSLGYEPLGYF